VAIYRKPKGAVARFAPDFNIKNCYTVQVTGTEFASPLMEAGLINNDPLGRILVVWDVSFSQQALSGSDPGVMTAGLQITNTAAVEPFYDPTPLFQGSPNAGGQGWFNPTSPGFVTPGNLGPRFWGNINWNWPHNYPIATLLAGYSISVVYSPDTATAVHDFSAMYEVVTAL